MEVVYIALTAGGYGIFMTVVCVWVGARVDRWADVHGIERPRRYRRISTVRNGVAFALLMAGVCGGTVLLSVGGAALAALGVVLIVASLAACIAIMKTGRTRPLPPLPAGLPERYDGLAYFWHCTLPRHFLRGYPDTEPRRGPCLRAK